MWLDYPNRATNPRKTGGRAANTPDYRGQKSCLRNPHPSSGSNNQRNLSCGLHTVQLSRSAINTIKMSLKEPSDDGSCIDCGTEIPEWRQQHTNKCIDCGLGRCRKCGTNIEMMSHTSNGGLCKPCSREVHGPGA